MSSYVLTSPTSGSVQLRQRLKTLRGVTPHEYVCKIWTEDPGRFRLDPIHHTTGLYA
jgi:hypothetical protein